MTGVVSGFGRIVSYAFNGLDMSSAANDVIVVRHRDGSLHSSPFHVRFGKWKVLRPQDKVVSIEVNGVLTKAVMKINGDGEAFWLQPTSHATDSRGESPVNPIASPILAQQYPGGETSPREMYLDPNSGVSRSRSPQVAAMDASPATSPKKVIDRSAPDHSAVVDFNDVVVVDPLHVTTEQPTMHALHEVKESLAALQAINTAGDDELTQVLPQVPCSDPAAVFVGEMTCTEREKYDDLIRSFTVEKAAAEKVASSETVADGANEGEPTNRVATPGIAVNGADGNHSMVLTLSKFASHDDVVVPVGAACMHMAAGASASSDAGMLAGSVATPALVPDDRIGVSPIDGMQTQTAIAPPPAERSGSVASQSAPSVGTDDGKSADLDEESGSELDDDDDSSSEDGSTSAAPKQYFKPTVTPMSADLEKLGLKPGHNAVRYITHSSLKGRVVVDSNIYFWPSETKIVVSDIDGTVTKSDVWGHILPMIGRDWTHAGICSLYSKVAKNGYEFVYLTARSMAQQEQTRKFLWSIEQSNDTLPRGPVLTAPDRFFTALTQEVSKKAHEFKISCLKSIQNAFPKHSKPFYAGFGNRIGDVVSYTATQIPKHKIFIIDTNSTLHVCRVRQTYKNLAHLVDVTFPPLKPSPFFAQSDDAKGPSSAAAAQPAATAGGTATHGGDKGAGSESGVSPSLKPSSSYTSAAPQPPLHHNGGLHEGESVDSDFNSFNFWRIPPEELLLPPPNNGTNAAGVVSSVANAAGKDSKKAPSGSASSAQAVSHPSLVQTPVPKKAPLAPSSSTTQGGKSSSSWLPRWLGGGGTDAQGKSTGSVAPAAPSSPPPTSVPSASQ